MGRLERGFGLVVLRLLGFVLLGTVLVVLVHPSDPNIDYDQGLVLTGLVACAVVAVGLLLLGASRARDRAARVGWAGWAWVAAGAVSVAAGGLALWMGWLLRYRYGWDASAVTGYSRGLMGGAPLSAAANLYLSRYPNNVALLALMNLAAAAGATKGLTMYEAFVVLNAACVLITVLLTFVLVRRLRGARAAFAAQALVVLLLAASPWSAVPYSDLPTAPLVLGAVAMACAALGPSPLWARTLLVVEASGLAAAAHLLKTTPATTGVAFTAAGLVVAIGLAGRRRLVVLLLVAVGAASFGAVAVGGSRLAYQAARVDKQELELDRTPPVAWWLANGLITSTNRSGRHYYGSYSAQLVKDSRRLRGQVLQDWSERRLHSQLAALGHGIVPFEVDKQAFVWGDGMFFAWGEGRDYEPQRLEDHSTTARAVQQFQHPAGAWYLTRSSLTNGVWLFVLLWAGTGLLCAAYRRETLVLALTVLGIMAFLLLFQARSRYVLAYVPVVVALAVTVDPRGLLRKRRKVAGDTQERDADPAYQRVT